MQGPVKTSPTFSQGGALIPFFALRGLGSSHTSAPLSDVRGGLRAETNGSFCLAKGSES